MLNDTDQELAVKDLTLLYELALAIGQSLNLEDNCERFLRVLIHHFGVEYGAIWIQSQSLPGIGNTGQHHLVYAFPEYHIGQRSAPLDPTLEARIREEKMVVMTDEDPLFEAAMHEAHLKEGQVVFFNLGTLGYLKLFSTTHGLEDRTLLKKMQSVMDRFAVSVEGCLCHQGAVLEAEEKLRLQTSKRDRDVLYKAVVDHLSQGLLITDKQNRIVFANSHLEQLTGYSMEEMKGQVSFELLLLREVYEAMLEKLQDVAHDSCNNDQQEILRKNGTRFWADITSSPYFNAFGEITGRIVMFTDITDKISSERQIRSLAKFPNENPFPVMRTDQEGMILFANQAAQEALTAMGTEVGDYLPTHLLPSSIADLDREVEALVAGRIITLSYNHIADSGYYNIYGKDITQSKNAQSALERSEKRYRQLVESASDMIYHVNGRGFFTYVNPVAIRVAGYSEQELIGRHFSELIAKDYQHRAIEFYRDQARKQVPGTYFEFPLVAKDGTVVWIGQNVRLQREGQKVIGFFAVARDITQRKHTERALIKARKRAEASSEAKKMFLANMSHEIRTPMNGILGMARLIGSSPLNDQQRTQLNAIQQSAEHLMALLNDILDFSKIEAGKLDVEVAGFRLKDMEEHLVRTLEIWAAEKDLLLLSHVDEQIAPVLLSDQVRLRQVLINLVSNAIKFTDRGKVELTCRLEREHDGHQWVRFEVNDTGIGIGEENLAAIFESFTQADPSVTRKYGGTGLGLAICGRLVQLLGGQLQVNSQIGEGSSFYFTLKFAVGTSRDITHTVDTKPTGLGAAHILVVEDNITNQYVTTSILENYGFTHRVADNGQEALDALAADNFDLILMDVQMPVMDGMEATRIIRQELRSDIPIIALTANILKGDHDKYLAMGMNETITKPFEPEHLQRTIARYTTQEKAPSGQLFDLSSLQDIAQGRSAVIQRMVTLFLEEVPRELERMQTCFHEGNRTEMSRIAHSLKPSFGFLRIHTLTELLRSIEQGDAMTADQLADNIDQLLRQSALVLSQLQEYAQSEELVKG